MANAAYRLSSVRNLNKQRILFDTNIWLLINGVNQGAPQDKIDDYSYAFTELLQNENEILVNDYVIGEYANRSAKLAFDLFCQSTGEQNTSHNFKRIRKTVDFRPEMDEIQASCLDMVRDCTYLGATVRCDIDRVINEFQQGLLDFTDLVLEQFCKDENAWLMTDDGDFADSSLTLITRNPHILRKAQRVI